jgi:6-phosphogluconolactonase
MKEATVEIFGDVAAMADRLAAFLSETSGRRISLALSGGNTPRLIFDHLSQHHQTLSWNRMDFYWGDERMVPPDHAESNFFMAKEHLFDRIRPAAGQIHRILGENDPEEESERYAAEIMNHVHLEHGMPSFDLILLGLGDDGHIASIFPDRMNLLLDERICRHVRHPETGQKRITLTGPVINNARKVVFLVTGRKKSGIVSEILLNKEIAKKYPAFYIKPENGDLYWLLDHEASLDL